jgi:hypothetical protein
MYSLKSSSLPLDQAYLEVEHWHSFLSFFKQIKPIVDVWGDKELSDQLNSLKQASFISLEYDV